MLIQIILYCVTGIDTVNTCEIHPQNTLDATNGDFFLSENQLSQCISETKELVIHAKEGQTMNVSQINLDHTDHNQDIYGTIKDVKSGKQGLIEHGPRTKRLMVSTSNEIALTLSDDSSAENRFMLHVEGKYSYILIYLVHMFECLSEHCPIL